MPTDISMPKRSFPLLIESSVCLNFLLPNGLILPLEVDSDFTLLNLKEELWAVAAKEPLFELLQPKDRYIFVGINHHTAEEEEYYDQTLRVQALPLLLPYLRVAEATKDSALLEKNKQDATIASCIGISHADLDHAECRLPEVKWARLRLTRLALMHRSALHDSGADAMARYMTSAPKRELSKWFENLLNDLSCLTISAWVLDGEEPAKERFVKVELEVRATVSTAISRLLKIQAELVRSSHVHKLCETGIVLVPDDVSAYLLKVCCSQAYLFDLDEPLISYTYVQQCLEQSQCPCLSPILRKDVCEALTNLITEPHIGSLPCSRPHSFPISSKHIPSKPVTVDRGGDLRCTSARLPRCGSVSSHQDNPQAEYDSPYQALENFARTAGAIADEEMESPVSGSLDSIQPDCKTASPLKKPSSISLWKLSGYLCVQVRSCKFLPENVLASHCSGSLPGSPTAQRSSALTSAFTASFHVVQSRYIVRVGLFHGSQSLIECQTTGEMSGSHMAWNKNLNFHILCSDIPPAARLCVSLIKVQRTASDKRLGRTSEYPVGWANLNFFDHQGFMISGDIILRLWPASFQSSESHFNSLYPAGTVLENPNPDFTLQIRILNPTKKRIRLPSFHSFIEAYSKSASVPNCPFVSSSPAVPGNMAFTNHVFGDVEEDTSFLEAEPDSSRLFISENNKHCEAMVCDESFVRELVTRDPLYEMSEQEKTALWEARYFCLKHLPAALPWLTQSMCWYRRETLMEFYHLLHLWPRPLPVPVALRLLGAMGLNTGGNGSAPGSVALVQLTGSSVVTRSSGGASGVADPSVRELAVSSLYNLTDAELCDYLLQLVQALKAEPYLDNPLSRFILFRALRNPVVIGLRFFWHLRSEIHLSDIRLKFGLLLEAFCVGCGPLLVFLARQVSALNRLEAISAHVKMLTNEDEQRELFRREIGRPEARRDLQWLPSPLCLSERLGELVVSKCDVKRSKKRPLWLVWTNADQLGAHHHAHHQLIFKHGDDLRQDMLTLQLLRVMDRIWKSEGLDMCLTPYGCLATGPEMGLIEAVRNARTVMSIQGERLRAALQIDSTQLYKWLTQRDHGMLSSQNSATYDRIIRNFTVSCAGYCVATFVLGIRDRHPDNIMVDTNGRLFHIDFGHILDNRKKKFGISRERVPFVLTSDFITVIARGNTDVALGTSFTDSGAGTFRNAQLQEFIHLCRRAYLLLRKHANLLLTLFAMMLPCGLPELSSLCDLEYVRKALALDMDDQQAVVYFNEKFSQAYYGAWTTKIDWFGHWMNT